MYEQHTPTWLLVASDNSGLGWAHLRPADDAIGAAVGEDVQRWLADARQAMINSLPQGGSGWKYREAQRKAFEQLLNDQIADTPQCRRAPRSREELQSVFDPDETYDRSRLTRKLRELDGVLRDIRWAEDNVPRVLSVIRVQDRDRRNPTTYFFVTRELDGEIPGLSVIDNDKTSTPEESDLAPDPPEPQPATQRPQRVSQHRYVLSWAVIVALAVIALLFATTQLRQPVADLPLEHTLLLETRRDSNGLVVRGFDDRGQVLWASPLSGGPGVTMDRWPRDLDQPPQLLAVASRAGGPDRPGELRVYDVRQPTNGEPLRVLRVALEDDHFRPTPESGHVGQAVCYGFYGVAFVSPESDADDTQPTLLTIAHDYQMAPTWLQQYDLSAAELQAEIYSPGNLDHLLVMDIDGQPTAAFAGFNNRLDCTVEAVVEGRCPPPYVAVVGLFDLPLLDGQLVPGTIDGLKVIQVRSLWRSEPEVFRVTEFGVVGGDGTGAHDSHLLIHGEFYKTESCWARWHLHPDGNIEHANSNCSMIDPRLTPIDQAESTWQLNGVAEQAAPDPD